MTSILFSVIFRGMVARLLLCLSGCATLAAGSVSAQETPAPDAADSNAARSGEIIVEGLREKEVRTFLRRAIVETGDVVTRRSTPICIGIDNAPASLSEPIRARITENLAALGIETAPPGCRVNAVVVFHEDAHAFVNWFARREGGAALRALYRPEKRRLIGPVRQAYAWHHIPAEAQRLRNAEQVSGGMAGDSIGVPPISTDSTRGRIMNETTSAESTHSFAVIDSDAIVGLTYAQVADWLTMQMLVEIRPQDEESEGAQTGANSILDLFTATGHNPSAPLELSPIDRALLEQIYGGTGDFRASAIRRSAARRVFAEVRAAGSSAPAPASANAPQP